MNEIVHLLKVEIKRTQNRIDSKRYVSVYNGVEVGTEKAEELNRQHLLFCQQVLDMIEKERQSQTTGYLYCDDLSDNIEITKERFEEIMKKYPFPKCDSKSFSGTLGTFSVNEPVTFEKIMARAIQGALGRTIQNEHESSN